MADNGQINVQYGLDVSQSTAQLKKLEQDLKSITANLVQAQGVIENNLKKMTADISASLAKAKTGSDQFYALQRRESRVTGNVLSSQGRGSLSGQITGATGNALIAEIRNSAEQTTAKIADELVKAYTQRLRTVDDVVAARIRQSQFTQSRTVANNTSSALNARQILADRRLQDQQYSAQYGQAALTTRNRMASLNEDGGSGIIAIQTRLLANYAALSLAFNAMRGLSSFVVQLDKEFRQFQAITATTNTEMATLKERLLDVAEASKFSAVQIAQAATVLGQAGLSGREVAESIGAIAQLATASGSQLTEAVDLVTSTMSIFNLTTSQTTDVANIMTSALNLSKLTIDKLTLGFQYAGNTAAQMGISFQELTGVLGALSNAGIRSGSTLGTGLRQLLIDLQNPTEEFLKTLKQLGLTQQDINVESNGLLPVLKALASAGFGAAEAFGSFEVRGAAAYVALSNNIDLAAQLEQQFILSSAAVEANAIQMESLANTYDRFVSIVGSLAYRSFDPIMKALQDVIKLVADFISQLDQIPGLLQAIGVIMTTLFAGIALSSIGALVKGLAMAVPLLGTFAAELTTAGAAAGTTTGIFAALWAVLARHPFVLIASAIIGVVSALYAFGHAGQTAAERVDILKAQVNEFKGQVDAANDQVAGINQTIENLIKQKAALDKDPLMRTNRILEVKQAFKEISDQVDTTTGSVDQLIDALRNLATTDFGTMSQSLTDALEANKALMSQYQTNINTTLLQAPTSVREQMGMTMASDDEIVKVFSQELGEKFGKYASMAMGRELLPKDVSDVNQISGDINSRITSLGSRTSILNNKRSLGTITDAESEELGRIPDYLALLNILKENLQPLVANRNNLKQIENENAILENSRVDAQVKSTFQYRDLAKDTDVLSAQIGAEFNDLMKNAEGKTAEQVLVMFNALQEKFTDRIDALNAKAEGYIPGIAQNAGTSTDSVRGVLKNLTDTTASLKARISTKINTENIEYQKLRNEMLKDELKTTEQTMNSVQNNLSRANTQEEVAYIREYMSKKFDEKRQITAAIYEAKIASSTDPQDILSAQSEAREAQKQINIDEQQIMEDLTQKNLDNKKLMIDDTKAAIDDEISATSSKLSELLQAIAKAHPGPAMDALISQFNLLSTALQQMTNQSNSLGIQSGTINTQSRAIPTGMADKANTAMEFFMSRGMSKAQASGIVGNLMTESGMSSTIYGDGGNAYGLAQWHPDRQKGLSDLASQRGVGRDDFMTQLEYIMKELPANGMTELQGAKTPSEAADIFRRLFERPTANPVIGQYGRRQEYANTLNSVDYSGQTQDLSKSVTDLADAQYKAVTAEIDRQADLGIKNSTQQIQTLVTQAGISNDPVAIQKLIGSVNDQYNAIIDANIEKFNQANPAKLPTAGLLQKGNIDLNNRQVVNNADGSFSTEQSMSFNRDGREILVPTVFNGAHHTNDEAISQYDKTGEHLGQFDNAANADAFAEALHQRQDDFYTQRRELVDSLVADQDQKVSSLLNTYWDALDAEIQKPVEEAKLRLSAAQAPENVNKFTGAQIQGLENNVALAERAARTKEVAAAEQVLVNVRSELAAATAKYGEGSTEQNYWLQEEATALDRVNELTKAKNAEDAATVQQGPTVTAAIQSATQAWAVQNGILDQVTGKMIPLSKQMEQSWGQVLDTLTNGFSNLFVDLVSGTMTAEEAFKKFGKSVVDQLLQMIAKALAMQIVMAAFGGESGGAAGGGLFDFLAPVLGVVAPGAASGEIIPGHSNRDSVLRKVMPGEAILRRSAVQSLGHANVQSMNAMGNRINSDSIRASNDNVAVPAVTNVWVVSPDQVPPLGPNDIVAVVSDNIQRRGSLKQLIKSVVAGS